MHSAWHGRRKVRILAFQANIADVSNGAQKTLHLRELSRRIEAAIDKARPKAIDLVALPELVSISYSRQAFERLEETAETLHGESFQVMREIAVKHATHVSFSLPRIEHGAFYIANMVINPDGAIETVYDKIHMAQFGASMEKEFFRRGHRLSVFDIGEFRVGVIICYDFRFPEYLRHLVEQLKVNLILHPVAFTRDGTFASWHHFVITRAMENQVYFLSLNRAGNEWGESIFCPPWIDGERSPTVFGRGEEARVFELNVAEIAESRSSYDFSGDRLPDYAALPLAPKP
jgi:nitrilase